MRRFDVYFLQRKSQANWQTVERASSVSVLTSALETAVKSGQPGEIRVVAGDWNEQRQAWLFSQIFFTDPGAIDISVGEASDEQEESATAPAAATAAAAASPTQQTQPSGAAEELVQRRSFAEAIRRANPDGDDKSDDEDEDEAPLPSAFSRRSEEPDTLPGFTPPPKVQNFRAKKSRRRGLTIALIVFIAFVVAILGAFAMAVVLDVPQARPVVEKLSHIKPLDKVIEKLQSFKGGDHMAGDDMKVMPEASDDLKMHAGVAEGLLGRWSPGECSETFIEFRAEGYVVGVKGKEPTEIKIIEETLEDDYVWYLRHSPNLLEHFQKLGPNDIQKIGDTDTNGFFENTSGVLSRC